MTTVVYALLIVFTVNDGMGPRTELRPQRDEFECKQNAKTLREAFPHNRQITSWTVECVARTNNWTPVR